MDICSHCNEEIDGTRTYGTLDFPMCWTCYCEWNVAQTPDVWYGLGPHCHDLSRTGSVIGSTVLDELPEKDNEGRIMVGNDVEFIPDPDAPGLGTYVRHNHPGWGPYS